MQSLIEAGNEKHISVKILKYLKPTVHFEIRGPTDQFSRMLRLLSFETIVQFC